MPKLCVKKTHMVLKQNIIKIVNSQIKKRSDVPSKLFNPSSSLSISLSYFTLQLLFLLFFLFFFYILQYVFILFSKDRQKTGVYV